MAAKAPERRIAGILSGLATAGLLALAIGGPAGAAVLEAVPSAEPEGRGDPAAFEAAKQRGVGTLWLRPGHELVACDASDLSWFERQGLTSGAAAGPILGPASTAARYADLGLEAKLIHCGPYSVGWDE